MVEPNAEEPSTSFRRVKKRPRTTRQQEGESIEKEPKLDGEEEDITARLSDIHEAQSTRTRRNGMTALECALGKKLASEFHDLDDDPFKMRGGKMLELSDDKKLVLEASNIESNIKEQFRKETLLRDEHEEMRKYIDQRLNRESETLDTKVEKKQIMTTTEDMILMKVADKLRGFQSNSSNNEELLSNQMLVGIPEVDLGIDVRIKNVMETEQRKTELMSKNKPRKPSDFK